MNFFKHFALKRMFLVNIRYKTHKNEELIWQFRFKTLLLHSKSSWFYFSSVAMTHLEILASNERYTNRLSRQNTEDIVHRVSCHSQSNKTKKSQTLIT